MNQACQPTGSFQLLARICRLSGPVNPSSVAILRTVPPAQVSTAVEIRREYLETEFDEASRIASGPRRQDGKKESSHV